MPATSLGICWYDKSPVQFDQLLLGCSKAFPGWTSLTDVDRSTLRTRYFSFEGATRRGAADAVADGVPSSSSPASHTTFVAATMCGQRSGLARTIPYCQRLLIFVPNGLVVSSPLREAYFAFLNSGGLCCQSITVVTPKVKDVEDSIQELQHAFVCGMEKLGSALPKITVMSSKLVFKQPAEETSARAVEECLSDCVSASPLLLANRKTPHQHGTGTPGCRVYVIGKSSRQRKVHVCVLAGKLHVGCRLLLPDPETYLTVSNVVPWSSNRGVNNNGGAAAAAGATTKQQVSRTQFGVGEVCTLDFRGLWNMSWQDFPVDVVVGDGFVGPYAVDGLFPKAPLMFAVATSDVESALQAAGWDSSCSSSSSLSSPMPSMAISLDGDLFMSAKVVVPVTKTETRSEEAQPNNNNNNNTDEYTCLEVDTTASEPKFALKRQNGGKLPNSGAVLEARQKSLKRIRLPSFTSSIQLVVEESPSKKRQQPQQEQRHNHRDPEEKEETIDVDDGVAAASASELSTKCTVLRVHGVLGKGFFVDDVVDICAWLDRKAKARLEVSLAGLVKHFSYPMKLSHCSFLDGTSQPSLSCPLSMVAAGCELSNSVPPYLGGKSPFQFLTNACRPLDANPTTTTTVPPPSSSSGSIMGGALMKVWGLPLATVLLCGADRLSIPELNGVLDPTFLAFILEAVRIEALPVDCLRSIAIPLMVEILTAPKPAKYPVEMICRLAQRCYANKIVFRQDNHTANLAFKGAITNVMIAQTALPAITLQWLASRLFWCHPHFSLGDAGSMRITNLRTLACGLNSVLSMTTSTAPSVLSGLQPTYLWSPRVYLVVEMLCHYAPWIIKRREVFALVLKYLGDNM